MKSFLVIAFFLLIFSFYDSSAKNIWEKQKKPVPGKPESIGTYTMGCAIGTEEIPLDGYGWQVMRPSRHRNYAEPEMYDYINKLAKNVKDNLNNILIVGDVGLPKGGAFSFGHHSHQIGLDADFWYKTPPAAMTRKLSRVEREKISAVNMVDNKTKTLNENWTEYQKNLLETAASFPEVDRIFVNPAIKRELCKTSKGEDWMEKIRPWGGHDEHFHVRLKCPANDLSCKLPDNYEPIKGDGCDATLDWWFQKRTKEELAEMKKKEELQHKQKMPERCSDLIKKNIK